MLTSRLVRSFLLLTLALMSVLVLLYSAPPRDRETVPPPVLQTEETPSTSVPSNERLPLSDVYLTLHDTVNSINHGHLAGQIIASTTDGTKRLHIDIDSPGGYVHVMMNIMNAMDYARQHGVTIVCTVTGQAASAAFMIFNHCSERYAYQLANLMWHSVGLYLDGPYNLVSLRALVSSLEAIQYWGNTMIQAQLKLDPTFFAEMWLTELTLTAPQLKALAPHYLDVIPYVPH